MWSLSLVMSECSLSGRGQGHASNFYIVDLENFATASRRYTGDTQFERRRFVYDTWDNGNRLGRVMVECTLYITHCLRLNLQLNTISLVRTCRISSFCTVVWQLARLLLTRSIARSLGDSWACLSESAEDEGIKLSVEWFLPYRHRPSLSTTTAWVAIFPCSAILLLLFWSSHMKIWDVIWKTVASRIWQLSIHVSISYLRVITFLPLILLPALPRCYLGEEVGLLLLNECTCTMKNRN